MAIADLVKTTLGPKGMVSLCLLAAERRSFVQWSGSLVDGVLHAGQDFAKHGTK